MKKAEEIAKRYKNFIVAVTKEEFIRAIKQIQLEAIDELAPKCSKLVDERLQDFGQIRAFKIDGSSIMYLANELKQEIYNDPK